MAKKTCLIVAFLISLILLSGCLGNKQSADSAPATDGIKYGVNDTTLVTIDSLPSGASVWLESSEKPGDAQRLGVTPLNVYLPKDKEYTVWLQLTLIEYRAMTRNITEIQQRLDAFERDEKYDLVSPNMDSFFETYSNKHETFTTTTYPPILVAVRIPHELSTLRMFGDKIRIAGIFVPAGMNPDVLLPLAGKKGTYEYSKEGYTNAMKRYNAPPDLVERSFSLLTRAGVALVIFPIEAVGNEPPQELVIRITAPSPDNPDGLAEWTSMSRMRRSYN